MAGLLLFDADCGFCTRSARRLARFGLSAEIAPLQAQDLPALGVDPDRALREIPYVAADGAVSYGSRAIADALGTGNTLWRLASRVLKLWPISAVAASCYRVIARHRHRLRGGTEACAVPSTQETATAASPQSEAR